MNVVKIFHIQKSEDPQIIKVPKDSKVLSVTVVHEFICVAIEADANSFYLSSEQDIKIEFIVFSENRSFYVDNYTFLDTIVLNFGNDLYHVFYRIK